METELVFHRFPREPTGPALQKLVYSFGGGQGVFDTWPFLVVQPPQSVMASQERPQFERERVLSFIPTPHTPYIKGRWSAVEDRFQIGVGMIWKDLEGREHTDYAVYPLWKPHDPDYRGPISRTRLLRALTALQWLPTIDVQHGDCNNTFRIAWGLSAPVIQPTRRSFYEEKLGRRFVEPLLIRLRYYRPERELREELGRFLHQCHVFSMR